MKPTKLVMSAFGPYLERTEIDFSKLNNCGLYLITGKTGAGKSTIFEALSYGLYGETVSGNKNRSASLLRNDMAEDKDETYVEVYFECNGKDYYIKRSPGYSLKALKRGKTEAKSDDDYKTHNSSVCLECREEGTSYYNETDVLNKVTSIIGIDKKNFRKICMIAQGEFMAVVREDTKQRKEVLNAIFDTEKYSQLTDELKLLKGEAADEKKKLSYELSAAAKLIVCSEEDPINNLLRSQTEVSATPDYYDELTEKTNELIKKEEDEFSSLNVKADENKNKLKAVSEKLEMIDKLDEKKNRLKYLTSEKERLEKDLPLFEGRLEACKDNPVKAEKLLGEAAVLKSVLPEYKKLEESRKQYTAVISKINTLEKEKKSKESKFNVLSDKIITEKARLAELSDVDARLADKKIEWNKIVEYGKRLRKINDSIKDWQTRKDTVEQKLKLYEASKAEVKEKEDYYKKTKHIYDSDLACYLASDLKSGCRCPVCGSMEHPFPAAAKTGAPTREELDAAEISFKNSEKASQQKAIEYNTAAADAMARIENIRNNAADIISTDVPDDIFGQRINEELGNQYKIAGTVKKDMEALEKLCEENRSLKASSEKNNTELERLRAELSDVGSKIEVGKENARHLQIEIKNSEEKLKHSTEKEASDEIKSIELEAQKLKRKYEVSQKALIDHNNKISENKGSIAQISQEIEEIPLYDKEALCNEKRELEKIAVDYEKEISMLKFRIERNNQAVSLITSNAGKYRKACEYYKNCEDLYFTASGSVPKCDRIGIQEYVQMGYLDSILEMSNIRLQKMMNNKYKLFRSGTVRNKKSLGGLDIDVFNCNKGKFRHVSSVSGGEAFVISLAMSIGLSDMIQHRAGGIHIDSMFIDEGFGTLDDDVLDMTIQALQNISTGNCTIGIISHVQRLKSTVTKRIEVETKDNKTTARVTI